MCLAYPGTVKKLSGLKATVEYPSSIVIASFVLEPKQSRQKNMRQVLVGDKKVKVGDKVLVQMGIIVKVISEKESDLIKKSWQEIGI
jgi:hydrogenase maturation factor